MASTSGSRVRTVAWIVSPARYAPRSVVRNTSTGPAGARPSTPRSDKSKAGSVRDKKPMSLSDSCANTTAGAEPPVPRVNPASKVAVPSGPVSASPRTALARDTSVTLIPARGVVSDKLRTITCSPSLPSSVEIPRSDSTNHCVAPGSSYGSAPRIRAVRA